MAAWPKIGSCTGEGALCRRAPGRPDEPSDALTERARAERHGAGGTGPGRSATGALACADWVPGPGRHLPPRPRSADPHPRRHRRALLVAGLGSRRRDARPGASPQPVAARRGGLRGHRSSQLQRRPLVRDGARPRPGLRSRSAPRGPAADPGSGEALVAHHGGPVAVPLRGPPGWPGGGSRGRADGGLHRGRVVHPCSGHRGHLSSRRDPAARSARATCRALHGRRPASGGRRAGAPPAARPAGATS